MLWLNHRTLRDFFQSNLFYWRDTSHHWIRGRSNIIWHLFWDFFFLPFFNTVLTGVTDPPPPRRCHMIFERPLTDVKCLLLIQVPNVNWNYIRCYNETIILAWKCHSTIVGILCFFSLFMLPFCRHLNVKLMYQLIMLQSLCCCPMYFIV